MGHAAGRGAPTFARQPMDMASATYGAFGNHNGPAPNCAPLGDGLQIGQRAGQWTATGRRCKMHVHRSTLSS